jgi:protein-tyrosine-phosphatase
MLPAQGGRMSQTYDVLFLCTGNSARSILAEAILNREGHGRFRAFSAGSFPKGEVHPMALQVLGEFGYSAEGYRSKSWDEFAAAGAPELDFIFTVCDNAAGEICPVWPGKPVTAHWGIDDPAAVDGERQHAAFVKAFHELKRRIDLFLSLPLDSIDEMTLASRLREIGKAESPVE